MRNFILILCCLVSLGSYAQEKKAFDPVSWKPPYTLSLDGWGIERFPIPIEFAPSIPFRGVEDIRFTPGWGKKESPEYWSYAFLWYVEGNPKVGAADISKNLSAYYDGLIGRNIEKRQIPKEMLKATKADFKQLRQPMGDDLATFTGEIHMLEYMAKEPMVLHGTVHIRVCPGSDHTLIFHELSPSPKADAVWSKLDGLWQSFSCQAASR